LPPDGVGSLSVCYAKGVTLHSPASRSVAGIVMGYTFGPLVRATLGCGMKSLRDRGGTIRLKSILSLYTSECAQIRGPD